MIYKKSFIGIALLCVGINVLALEMPSRPNGYVHDEAQIVSPQTNRRLSDGLRKFELDTGHQIVVATFPSLESESLEDFSIRLAEKWKIGRKNADDGVILLVFPNDRKVRIEVGYGLESVLTDVASSRIINTNIVPAFRRGDTDAAIFGGVLAIMETLLSGEDAILSEPPFTPASPSGHRTLSPEEIEQLKSQTRAVGFFVLFLVIGFFVIDFIRYRNYSAAHKDYLRHYTFWEWWFRFAILLFVLNLIFKMIFYSMLFSRGGRYGGRSGFGGFSGGGGGSFGGGGASGSW